MNRSLPTIKENYVLHDERTDFRKIHKFINSLLIRVNKLEDENKSLRQEFKILKEENNQFAQLLKKENRYSQLIPINEAIEHVELLQKSTIDLNYKGDIDKLISNQDSNFWSKRKTMKDVINYNSEIVDEDINERISED